MEEEENNHKNKLKFKTLNYFNYANEDLDLWTMQYLLTFNKSLVNYIKNNFKSFSFEIGKKENVFNLVDNKKIDYNYLPDLIWLISKKYRNIDAHWWKVFKKEELEELRNIMLYWEGILIKLLK